MENPIMSDFSLKTPYTPEAYEVQKVLFRKETYKIFFDFSKRKANLQAAFSSIRRRIRSNDSSL